MDLEKLNSQYQEVLKKLEKAKQEAKDLQTKVDDLSYDKLILRGKQAEARKNGNKAEADRLEGEIKKLDETFQSVYADAVAKSTEVQTLQDRINEKLAVLEQSPELKPLVNEVLAKRYQRKINKMEKEVEELTERKEKIDVLNKLVTEHPTLGNNLKGIMAGTRDLKALQEELEALKTVDDQGNVKYNNPTRAAEINNTLIPAAKQKINTNKQPLMAYINKNKINIEEKDIDDLAGKYVLDGKGEIDLKTTFAKETASINRQLKGLNKSLEHHKGALAKTGHAAPESEHDDRDNGEDGRDNGEGDDGRGYGDDGGATKPKWWQFIKRFRNWRNERRQEALPEPEPEPEPEPVDVKKEFRDSLKYAMVRDIVDNRMKQELRDAKNAMREPAHQEPAEEHEEQDDGSR